MSVAVPEKIALPVFQAQTPCERTGYLEGKMDYDLLRHLGNVS